MEKVDFDKTVVYYHRPTDTLIGVDMSEKSRMDSLCDPNHKYTQVNDTETVMGRMVKKPIINHQYVFGDNLVLPYKVNELENTFLPMDFKQ